ncbi:rRNA maturation RNase YbeY [Thioalkalivibrio sulfidiphilus]|uniref:Endoribonuclease YbeY n=1 Tax=Thioalkalivibrio sulfidiphilus (strain HL-EbGR7) TaxID=396588 RepID=B8GV24_THISH|nr:rRNA maturation RNase YbeY [Thioalkalivibrio sulfidiphilus]ACL73370.1 metal-dependent hydrolase [Thioalkalivibrio sulfidiphilus HL-EbGr7]
MALHTEIQLASEAADIPVEASLERWAAAAWQGDEDEASVVIRVVDEAESAELNGTYRHKQGPTNVLSFPFEAPPEFAEGHLGDLVICAPVVLREAAEQGKTAEAHWAHMVIHGMLHLQGHDHIEDAEAARMEALEKEILSGLGYENPYE